MAKKYTLKSDFWMKSEKETGQYSWVHRQNCDVCHEIIRGVSYTHLGEHKRYCHKCAMEYLRKANAGEIEVKEKPRDTFLDQPIGDLIMISREASENWNVERNTRRALTKVLDEFKAMLTRIDNAERGVPGLDFNNARAVLAYVKGNVK